MQWKVALTAGVAAVRPGDQPIEGDGNVVDEPAQVSLRSSVGEPRGAYPTVGARSLERSGALELDVIVTRANAAAYLAVPAPCASLHPLVGRLDDPLRPGRHRFRLTTGNAPYPGSLRRASEPADANSASIGRPKSWSR